MKVAFNIPDTTVDIAVAMIRAKAVDDSPRDKETLELAISKAKQADCINLDSAEIFDDQQAVVLIGLAIAAISELLK